MNGEEDISQYPAAVRRAILIESGNTAAMSVGGRGNRKGGMQNSRARGGAMMKTAMSGGGAMSRTGPMRTDMTFAKDQFCSVGKEVFEALTQCGCSEAPISDARFVALSSSHNKAFLEPPFNTPPLRLHPSVTIMYITGEHMLKDRFLCARYVMSGSEYQPRVVNHTAPGPLKGTYVERPSTGPLGKGCRVMNNPVSWYAPGRVLQQVPPQPMLHDKKLVVVTACCLVKGDGSVYLSSSGGAMLIDAQRMAAQDPEVIALSTLSMDTRCLVPALVNLFTRFFSYPFAVQSQGASQARLFRVDGWMSADVKVHSIELHPNHLKDIMNAHGPPQPVIEMAQALIDPRSAERVKIANVQTRSVDDAHVLDRAQEINETITRLMTAGDAADPFALAKPPKAREQKTGDAAKSKAKAQSTSNSTKSKRAPRRRSTSEASSQSASSASSTSLSDYLSDLSDGDAKTKKRKTKKKRN